MTRQSGGRAPHFSIIMATRNLVAGGRSEAVSRAVASLFEQTCLDAEVLVQDGGSSDGTMPLLQRLFGDAPGDLDIRFESRVDGGIYEAMNRGAERARGRYLVFLNSDDALADPGALSRLSGPKDADFVYGATVIVGPDGSNRLLARMAPEAILQRMPFGHNSMAIRSDVFQGLGGHDTRFPLAADYDLAFRLLEAGHCGVRLSEPVYQFHTGGATSDYEAVAADYASIWRERFSRYLDISTYSTDECVHWFRRGHLPFAVPLAVWRGSAPGSCMRRAALHSMMKTARRELNPFRKSR